jgi:HSP90 family molecular chaperone
VTEELERRWNQALQRVHEIDQRIEQHAEGQGRAARPTRKEFEDLAADLEAVWNDPDADVRLKKRIARTLIHEIVADVDAEGGEVRYPPQSGWLDEWGRLKGGHPLV